MTLMNYTDDNHIKEYDDNMMTLTAAAMRTPEKGPRKAPNVAAITRTYLAMDDYENDYDDND